MGAIASQITSLTIVYSDVYSDVDQRKHQSSASLAFVQGIHRRPVNSPHKWPVTRKMFPFDDVIMVGLQEVQSAVEGWPLDSLHDGPAGRALTLPLKKQFSCWWFRRHDVRDVTVMQLLIFGLQDAGQVSVTCNTNMKLFINKQLSNFSQTREPSQAFVYRVFMYTSLALGQPYS